MLFHFRSRAGPLPAAAAAAAVGQRSESQVLSVCVCVCTQLTSRPMRAPKSGAFRPAAERSGSECQSRDKSTDASGTHRFKSDRIRCATLAQSCPTQSSAILNSKHLFWRRAPLIQFGLEIKLRKCTAATPIGCRPSERASGAHQSIHLSLVCN